MDKMLPKDVNRLEGELLLTVLDAWRIATGDDDMPTYLQSAWFAVDGTDEEWLVHAFFETGSDDYSMPEGREDDHIHLLYITDNRMDKRRAEKPHLSDAWGNAIYST